MSIGPDQLRRAWEEGYQWGSGRVELLAGALVVLMALSWLVITLYLRRRRRRREQGQGRPLNGGGRPLP